MMTSYISNSGGAMFIVGHILQGESPRLGRIAGTDWSLQPAWAEPHGGITLVADARIDNRDALRSQLDLPPDPQGRDDEDLLLHVYQRWGAAMAERLVGDFAIAVLDEREQRLLLIRDHLGCRPLFYAELPQGFLFASRPREILAHPLMDTTLDEAWIAGMFASMATLDPSGSMYQSMNRLPAGHTLIHRHGESRVVCYWTPEPEAVNGLGTENAWIEEGRARLDQAVADRMVGDMLVGSEFSGGLDSCGVAATAWPLLRRQGRDFPLFTMATDPAWTRGGGMLTTLAEVWAAARHMGHDDLTFLTGQGRGVLATIAREMERHGHLLTGMALMSDEVYEAAAGRGVGVMLSGWGGDNCFSHRGSAPLFDLVRAGRYAPVWRHCRAEAGLPRALRVMAGLLLRRHAPQLWQQLRTRPDFSSHDRRIALLPLTAAVKARYDVAHQALCGLRFLTTPGGVDRRPWHLRKTGLTDRLESTVILAAGHGINYRFPLLDKRLISFCLALPPALRIGDGFNRLFARRVLSDRLSAELVWSKKSLTSLETVYDKFSWEWKEVVDRVRKIEQDRTMSDIIDVSVLTSVLNPGDRATFLPETSVIMIALLSLFSIDSHQPC